MGEKHRTSRLAGFYNLPLEGRRARLAAEGYLSAAELEALTPEGSLPGEVAGNMIENVIGRFSLPVGVATNFIVNGREVLVPMVVEEPSIVAGASYMAKLARSAGGFAAEADPPVMIGQVQLLDVRDPERTAAVIQDRRAELLDRLSGVDPVLVRLGGGPRDLEVRHLETAVGDMLIVHLTFDVRDAMGANAVNTACERLAPALEELTGARAGLRILSNLADTRLARSSCTIPAENLAFEGYAGAEVRDRIIEAWAFADADPYRAATHNKGIMNGIDAVVLATANDWRAVEAGAHAYAAREGRYRSLTRWSAAEDGSLRGELELPLAVGIVGGATRVHPGAQAALSLLQVSTAGELAEVMAAVGLAQNLAALRALATEGIQRGHMALHARQVAVAAGAEGEQIQRVADQLVREGRIGTDRAAEILSEEEEPSS